MPILVQEENEQDQANIFQDTYTKSYQIHQLSIMRHFEHAINRIHQNQNLWKLLLRFCNLQ